MAAPSPQKPSKSMNSEIKMKKMKAGFRKLMRAKPAAGNTSNKSGSKGTTGGGKICSWGDNFQISSGDAATIQEETCSKNKKQQFGNKMTFGKLLALNHGQTPPSANQQSGNSSVTETEDATSVGVPSVTFAPPLQQQTIQCSPQSWLDSMLCKRSYSTQCFNAVQTAYYNRKPTQLQLASFDEHLLELVQQGRVNDFRTIMEAGVSLNPVSSNGLHLIHAICAMTAAPAAPDCLRILIELGCSLQVSDKQGRTPLHIVCAADQGSAAGSRASIFELVELILDEDRHQLHMRDAQGNLPLSLIPPTSWAIWVEFMEAHKDEFWPDMLVDNGAADLNSSSHHQQAPPLLIRLGPNKRSIPNPPHAVTPRLAALLVSGTMEPSEAGHLIHCEGFNQQHSCGGGNSSRRHLWGGSSSFLFGGDGSASFAVDGEGVSGSFSIGDDLRDALDKLEPATARMAEACGTQESTIAEKKKRDALLGAQQYNPNRW